MCLRTLRSPAYRVLLVAAMLAGFTTLGCGSGSGKASITGVVKCNGEPLPSGVITFVTPQQSEHSNIVDGKYSIPSIEAGKIKVTVATFNFSTAGASPSGAAAQAPVGKYVPINQKYNNVDSSGLDFEAKSGAQTKNFEVSP